MLHNKLDNKQPVLRIVNGRADYISYSHNGRADYISYSHNGRADYISYSHDDR